MLPHCCSFMWRRGTWSPPYQPPTSKSNWSAQRQIGFVRSFAENCTICTSHDTNSQPYTLDTQVFGRIYANFIWLHRIWVELSRQVTDTHFLIVLPTPVVRCVCVSMQTKPTLHIVYAQFPHKCRHNKFESTIHTHTQNDISSARPTHFVNSRVVGCFMSAYYMMRTIFGWCQQRMVEQWFEYTACGGKMYVGGTLLVVIRWNREGWFVGGWNDGCLVFDDQARDGRTLEALIRG